MRVIPSLDIVMRDNPECSELTQIAPALSSIMANRKSEPMGESFVLETKCSNLSSDGL